MSRAAHFQKRGASRRSKAWSFLISGEFLDRLETRFLLESTSKGTRHLWCCCTSELKRIWQTLQEMTGRLVLISGTPKVWFITAFCTGSICGRNDRGRKQRERRWKSVSHKSASPLPLQQHVCATDIPMLKPDRLISRDDWE